MTYVMVDVETTGPVPGDYSMFWIGAVVVEPGLSRRFEGKLKPLYGAGFDCGTENNPGLNLAKVTYAEVMEWPEPSDAMRKFDGWLKGVRRKDGDQLMLVSDNNGFDAMFVSWYFHHFLGRNPFGHSSTNLGSLYKGLVRDVKKNFKHLRETKHTHNPVDDAVGNAEAMLKMKDMGLRIFL